MNKVNHYSSSGVVISTKLLVAVFVVIALLLSLTLVGFSSSTSSSLTTNSTTNSLTTNVTNTQNISTVFTRTVSVKTINVTVGNQSNLGINPEQIYSMSNQSLVTLVGTQVANNGNGPAPEVVLGSGFVVNSSNSYYIVTNYHVAGATSNLTITFTDGDAYSAKVIGSDPYSDLAVVSGIGVPVSEYHPLTFASSSTLAVGQYVLALGNPYGLEGSLTFGIVSQLGRTLQDPTAGNFSIAGVIQFSAPINPGNSGGVLLNGNGLVVGITTAVVSGSQGVGFAIPSDTIIRELPYLITNGSYNLHSYLGIGGADMGYQLAKASGTNVTYGVLVESVVPGGPGAKAGLIAGNETVTINGIPALVGGDIITSINGTKIINNDALASYLVDHTIPGQTIVLGIIRNGTATSVNAVIRHPSSTKLVELDSPLSPSVTAD